VTYAAETCSAFAASFFQYSPRLRPSQRVVGLYIPAKGTEAKPGTLSWRGRAYLKQPLDDTERPGVIDIIFIGPTRVGKTFILKCGVLYKIRWAPGPLLWMNDNAQNAREFVELELEPMINANPEFRALKPKNTDKDALSKKIYTSGTSIVFKGSRSTAAGKGKTAEWIFLNEAGEFLQASGTEASVLELVRHRTESYNSTRRHLISSTPSNTDSELWQFYLRGTRFQWQVPCHACGMMQVMEFGGREVKWGLKWDPAARDDEGNWDLARVEASAHYVCRSDTCDAHWDNKQRKAAVDLGEWIQTNPHADPTIRSYQVNGLVGPDDKNNFGPMARAYLATKRGGLVVTNSRDFWNQVWGIPYSEDIVSLTAAKMKHLMRPYKAGELPKDFVPHLLLIGGDVQANRLEFVIRAFNYATAESYLVETGTCLNYSDLALLQRHYSAKFNCPSACIIDIQYEDRRGGTVEAIMQYSREGLNWCGAEAVEWSKTKLTWEERDPYSGTAHAKMHLINVLTMSAYDVKVELEKKYAGIIKGFYTFTPAQTVEAVAAYNAYILQIINERRRPAKGTRMAGKPIWEWFSPDGNNHRNDCEKYIAALYVHFWQLYDWSGRLTRGAAKTPESALPEASESAGSILRK
jgi:hypothetical protein